jgi:hypothetical protein
MKLQAEQAAPQRKPHAPLRLLELVAKKPHLQPLIAQNKRNGSRALSECG